MKCARILISTVIPKTEEFCFLVISLRFTRPENLGSESKIRCSKCRSYQVRNHLCLLLYCSKHAVQLEVGIGIGFTFSCGVCVCLGVNQETDCQEAAYCDLLPPQGVYVFGINLSSYFSEVGGGS